jgi:membrane protein implicated in regulation of membrane protease activity
MQTLLIIWLVIAVGALAIEVATTQLIALYIAAGALVAALVTVLGLDVPVQVIVFAVVTVVALVTTRTAIKRALDRSSPLQPMNVNALVGEHAVVTERIDNLLGHGYVVVRGESWQARSSDDSEIDVGQQVQVDRIDGVSVFVSRLV